MVDWVGQAKGLAFPLAYLTLLIGLMATFSSLYRKRQAARAASLEPWFGSHLQRNVYLSLLHLEQAEPGKEKPVTVPDSVIKAALLRRATEDIQRIVSMRSAKQALSTLLQRGSVGDDLWQRFQRGEKELQAELEDVVSEANALSPGWGSTIFQSANEMNANARLRDHIADLQARAPEERTWWDRKRSTAQKELLEELEEEEGQKQKQQPQQQQPQQQKLPVRKDSVATSASSDGEPVLVERDESAASAAGTPGGKKKKNKNKGKK